MEVQLCMIPYTNGLSIYCMTSIREVETKVLEF